MMTARKRVGSLPTHRLAVRYSSNYSFSNHVSSNDSSRDSLSSSSSDTSSDFLAVLLASGSRTPAASVPLSSPTLGALSYARADLLPSPKRIRKTGLGVDFVDESSEPSRFRGTDLEMDVDVMRSNGIDIDPKIQVEIDECIAYADALRDRGIDARVVVEAIDREEIEKGMRDPVEVRVDRVTHLMVAEDIPEPAQEGAVEVTYETLGDLVQRIIATRQQSADMSERFRELERDNMRLRDMMDVASQRVARSQRREVRV
ncbi:hypothetical protein Tco_0085424 [Tanacetum coccineum]